MSAAKPDRRVERTRVALLQAFIDLVLSQGYDSTTVDAVAARANVGRSTFYVHFRGKEDILKHSMGFPNRELARALDADTTAEQLVPILEHFHTQRRINRVFFEAPVRNLWIRQLAALIEAKLAQRRCPSPLLPVSLVAMQVAEFQVGLSEKWLSGRHPLKPLAIAEAMLAGVRATIAALLPV